MKREIRLSKRAMKKPDKSLKQIQKLPDSFPESETINGLRKCVITKQTTVFYKYSETTINVVTIFDNRQNPKSLTKETKV